MVKIVSRSASWVFSTTINAKRIDAKPRGPNQPRKIRVWPFKFLPNKLKATGNMRTRVKLNTAYNRKAPSICPGSMFTCLALP
jgi:hypothetical protein